MRKRDSCFEVLDHSLEIVQGGGNPSDGAVHFLEQTFEHMNAALEISEI